MNQSTTMKIGSGKEFFSLKVTWNKRFRSKMVIYHKGLKDSFYNAALYAVIFKMCKKFDFITNENEIGKTIGVDTFQKF